MRVMGIKLLEKLPVFQIYESSEGQNRSERELYLILKKEDGSLLGAEREFVVRDKALKVVS